MCIKEEHVEVFLTGGTGYIGQPLTKSLLGRGWSVTALVRKPKHPRAQALSKMGAQLAKGDITDRESMRAPMSRAKIVVHNAGNYEVGLDPAGKQRMQRVNVDGTENVLGLAYELSIPRTIYVSTIQTFGETGYQLCDETFIRQYSCRTTYERTKTDAHTIACQYQQRGLPLIIVCPNGVIGVNDQSFVGYMIRLYVNHAFPPICWSTNACATFVALNDVVEGITLTAEKGRTGETYFLCGESISTREIFNCFRRKSGGFAPRVWLPTGLMAAMLTPLEPLERMLGLPAFLSREAVRTGSTNWNYSNEKAKRELGWTTCCAEVVLSEAIDGELELLSRRKGQNLIQRLKPLDTVE
jgi:nucleoside-diphosphate-sugar epimerase